MNAAKSKRRWYRLTLNRLVVGLLVAEFLLWIADLLHGLPKGVAVLFGIASLGVVALLILFCTAVSLIFHWHFQVSIRSLFVMVVELAIVCGWLAGERACSAAKGIGREN